VAGVTLDTGALIALERRSHRMRTLLKVAMDDGMRLTVPSPVIAEWWRGRTDVREQILDGVDVESLDVALAKVAGEALASVAGATLVDAIVMASAARRGDVVLTSDVQDLERLRRYFASVPRVLGV
jgi:predicted nucleic acid-binding protein